MRHRTLLACVLLGVPVLAWGQPRAGTVFAGAGALAAIERDANTLSVVSLREDDTRLDGTVAGGMVAVGVHATPAWSARFEWARTGELSDTTADPGSRLLAGGTLVPAGLTILPTRTELTRERRTTTGYVLVGYHLGSRRVALELLGGLGILHERRLTRMVTELDFPFPGIPPSSTTTEVISTGYAAVPVVGADVGLRLSAHAALVPGLRAHVVNGSLSVRPTAVVRWTF